jgi:hypothetical protein
MKAGTRKFACLDMLLAAGSPGSAAAYFRIAYAEQENHRLKKRDSFNELSNKVQPSERPKGHQTHEWRQAH